MFVNLTGGITTDALNEGGVLGPQKVFAKRLGVVVFGPEIPYHKNSSSAAFVIPHRVSGALSIYHASRHP